MPTLDEFKKSSPTFTILACGMLGTGKTHLGMTFPKVFYLGFEPNGLDILRTPDNKKLLENLVHYEYVQPKNDQEIKEWFNQENYAGKIYKNLDLAAKLQQEGKVATLFIDNLTYMVEQYWDYIRIYKKVLSEKTGAFDLLRTYGHLRTSLMRLWLMTVLPFKGNIVASVHLKREAEEAMEHKVNRKADVSPNIQGAFKDLVGGLFGAVVYLDQVNGKRVAYCQPQRAFGSDIQAKNRYGLPPIVENICYQTLWNANQTKGSQVK